eukprot:COSAG01_NODE_9664_length_2376_cov_1.343434_3_plen_175_part_00
MLSHCTAVRGAGQRAEVRAQKQVQRVVEVMIKQLESEYNKGLRESERAQDRLRRQSERESRRQASAQRQSTGQQLSSAQTAATRTYHIEYQYLGFADLVPDMYCEIEWEQGEQQVWYRAFVRATSEHGVTMFYPETGEEERLKPDEITPGMVRRPLCQVPVAPWIATAEVRNPC